MKRTARPAGYTIPLNSHRAIGCVVGRAACAMKLCGAAVLLAGGLSASGCVPLVAITAAATTVDVASDRRTTGKYVDDNSLELKLRKQFAGDESLGKGVNISVTVFNGVVLLTGEVNSDAQRQHAEQLSYEHAETAKVVNELELAGRTNLTSRANDAWITAKVKTKIWGALDLKSSQAIKVVTEHGRVYLLGQVSRAEADIAVDAIRGVRGVTHIVKVFEYIE